MSTTHQIANKLFYDSWIQRIFLPIKDWVQSNIDDLLKKYEKYTEKTPELYG